MKTSKATIFLLALILCLSSCAPVSFLLNAFTADTAIKAKCKLPPKALVLVMVDDPNNVLGSRPMVQLAASQANYLLKKHEAAHAVIPGSKLTELESVLGKQYQHTAVTTIGKSLGADIVIHAKIISASLNNTINIYQPEAQVRVKVIDIKNNTRLFPDPGDLDNSEMGYLLKIKMDHRSSNGNNSEIRQIAMRELCTRIGSNIARIFYDHGKRQLSQKQ